MSIELRIEKKEPPEPAGPEGSDSLVIHQDQPRYLGFQPQEQPPMDSEGSK